jgi:hypothetical protein
MCRAVNDNNRSFIDRDNSFGFVSMSRINAIHEHGMAIN